MSQPQKLLSVMLLLSAAVFTSLWAQVCISDDDFASALKNRAPAADGKIHVTYSFGDTVLETKNWKSLWRFTTSIRVPLCSRAPTYGNDEEKILTQRS